MTKSNKQRVLATIEGFTLLSQPMSRSNALIITSIIRSIAKKTIWTNVSAQVVDVEARIM